MHDAAQVLAFFAAALLIAAIATWINLLQRPRLQRLDGRRAPGNDGVETASQLLVAAVSVSALAALLALMGMFSN